MNLYEYEAKKIFHEFGIPVPPSARITKPEELRKVHFGYPIALKCQVLSGGRGKAGGIKFPKDLKEAEAVAKDLLKLTIGGSKTESLLIEPGVQIAQELYLSVTLDRAQACPIFIASAEGGVEIETSHNVVTMPISYPYSSFQGRKLAKMLGLKGGI
ncbi:MAG: ATP-grasp domain-containing protein, partial [Terriglobales bacterium]